MFKIRTLAEFNKDLKDNFDFDFELSDCMEVDGTKFGFTRLVSELIDDTALEIARLKSVGNDTKRLFIQYIIKNESIVIPLSFQKDLVEGEVLCFIVHFSDTDEWKKAIGLTETQLLATSTDAVVKSLNTMPGIDQLCIISSDKKAKLKSRRTHQEVPKEKAVLN